MADEALDPDKQKAVHRFQSLAGSPPAQATNLVDALVFASRDQLLEMITGSGTVPSNMVAARAELLYYACVRAARILTQREVEVLFRTLPTTAKSILATMQATYEEALREQFLSRMREGAKVTAAGSDDTELRWVITFSDASDLQTAWDEIQRLGFSVDAILNSRAKSIDIPRKATVNNKHADTLPVLGLQQPGAPKRGQRSQPH